MKIPGRKKLNLLCFFLIFAYREKSPIVVPLWVNPVQHLRAQSAVPKFHRRPRKSEIVSSIQGAPCRKLPELEDSSQKETSTPISVAESELASVKIKEDNPFRYLLGATDRGKIAFAFYVMDCWEQRKGLNGNDADDKEEFVKQCSKWWTDFPTPYRRIYWSKEIEYSKKKNSAKVLGRTWFSNNFEEKSSEEGIANNKDDGKRKLSPESSQASKIMRMELVSAEDEENEENYPLHSPAFVDCNNIVDHKFQLEKKILKQAPPKNSKKERSFELLKAFSNFQKIHREKVTNEIPGVPKIEVKRELGRRWKLLDEKQKIKYLDPKSKSPGKQGEIENKVNRREYVYLKLEVEDEFFNEG